MAFNRVATYLDEEHPEFYINPARIEDVKRIQDMCCDEGLHISLVDAEVIWEKYSYDSGTAQNTEIHWRLLPSEQMLYLILFGNKDDVYWIDGFREKDEEGNYIYEKKCPEKENQ